MLFRPPGTSCRASPKAGSYGSLRIRPFAWLGKFFDTVPRLFLGAIGGAISDRFDRRRVLIITQSLAMVQAIVYCFAVYFKVILFWHIAVLAFCWAVSTRSIKPCASRWLTAWFPKKNCSMPSDFNRLFFNLSKILGPSVEEPLLRSSGYPDAFSQCPELRGPDLESLSNEIAALGSAAIY